MTGRKQEITERLRREFEKCDLHLMRIDEALHSLRVEVPMSTDCYAHLKEEQIRCLDQFIFRFSKLQDAMGAKIFRYILEYLDEDVSALPMRDVLNRLERYSIVPDAGEWLYIRELRNEIAHDYPLAEDDVVGAVNELIAKVDIVQDIYDRLKDCFAKGLSDHA